MARSTAQIYNYIVSEINSYSNLSGSINVPADFETFNQTVTSGSKVAVEGHILYGVAYAIHTLEVIFDAFRRAIDQKANRIIPQTDRWMRDETLKFQLGYGLVWDGEKYVYAQDDDSAKVVDQSAIVTSGNNTLIKVAKDNGGDLSPLSASEKTALAAYWDLKKPPGMKYSIISEAADDLKVEVDIIYDPLLMNPDGTMRSDGSKPVDEAIKSYNQGLDFNGRFWTDKFVDAMQAAEGVISVDLNLVEAKYGSLSYQTVDKYYDSYAGYLKLDTNNSTINYLTA